MHILATDLGMTVWRLKQDMPMSELYDWVAYYEEKDLQEKGQVVEEHDWENMNQQEIGKAFKL